MKTAMRLIKSCNAREVKGDESGAPTTHHERIGVVLPEHAFVSLHPQEVWAGSTPSWFRLGPISLSISRENHCERIPGGAISQALARRVRTEFKRPADRKSLKRSGPVGETRYDARWGQGTTSGDVALRPTLRTSGPETLMPHSVDTVCRPREPANRMRRRLVVSTCVQRPRGGRGHSRGREGSKPSPGQ